MKFVEHLVYCNLVYKIKTNYTIIHELRNKKPFNYVQI